MSELGIILKGFYYIITNNQAALDKLRQVDFLESLYRESRGIDTLLRHLELKKHEFRNALLGAKHDLAFPANLEAARYAKDRRERCQRTLIEIDNRMAILRERKDEIQKTLESPTSLV